MSSMQYIELVGNERSRLHGVEVFNMIQAYRPLQVLVACNFSILMLSWHACRGLQFQHATFDRPDDIANITFVKQGDWYKGRNASYSGSAIWLTPAAGNANDSTDLGRIVYKDPIQFIQSNRTASFSTSFSFQIITTTAYGLCGSGMVFFISNSEQAPQDSDEMGALGLVNPTDQGTVHFFAVEFDTHQSPNFHDPSASHIGININSMISSNITDTSPDASGSSLYPQLYLYNNYTFTAWIEYSASSNLIQVWMTNTTSDYHRPLQPCLQLHSDLSSVLEKPMYVGFAATSAPLTQSAEGHVLYSWNFSTEAFSANTSNCESCGAIKSKLLLALTPPGVFLAVAVCSLFLWIAKRRHRRRKFEASVFRPSNGGNDIDLALSTVPRYSYRELRKAAHGFGDKNKVGEGGFSTVYRAILADGSMVAVKKLKESLRREADFCSEIRIISSVRHRNLLQLEGWCYEKGEALLVYKYMSNGSLDNYLFGKKKGTALERETRFRILVGVAAALEYLHGGLGNCVLHRDVKAANVLLTEEFEPILSDFGLARLISRDKAASMTAAGTPGRIAPEVLYTGRATDKADVYSFGVLALEVACGCRAMDRTLKSHEEKNLVDWVWMLHQRNKLIEVLDPSIQTDRSASQAEQQWRCVLHVALMCCHPLPESRPSMRQVTQALQDTVLIPLPTTRPAYPYTTSPTSLPPSCKTLHRGGPASALPLELYCGCSSSAVTTSSLGRSSVSVPTAESEPLSPR